MQNKNNSGEILGGIVAVLVVLALVKDYVGGRWEILAVWIGGAAIMVGLYWLWGKITGKE